MGLGTEAFPGRLVEVMIQFNRVNLFEVSFLCLDHVANEGSGFDQNRGLVALAVIANDLLFDNMRRRIGPACLFPAINCPNRLNAQLCALKKKFNAGRQNAIQGLFLC